MCLAEAAGRCGLSRANGGTLIYIDGGGGGAATAVDGLDGVPICMVLHIEHLLRRVDGLHA